MAAIDCRLTNGSLRAYYVPADEQALNATPQSIYLYRNEGSCWQFELAGTDTVTALIVASSMAEL
ncbi:hypothetical protein [Endozoicomonas sp. GU-1]|uniref:hypothetical protein n=1 Tax=Endozoicomonas sp. GU-1 TaxID=3009078 RepID=UPI0022B41FB4|nr:hypothetical protein [Endozoicomonas sp. GU-1]WBA84378.1 hypothetical protein O3276_13825 [Endozoicomonas sp. GU-1]